WVAVRVLAVRGQALLAHGTWGGAWSLWRTVMRIASAVCAVALVATAAACGSSGGGSERNQLASGGTYVTSLTADPGNLNPLTAIKQTTNSVVTFAYDTLININPDGKIVPQLAEDWQATPSSVTYTLKDGITCSDGTPLTAKAVADNFLWAKNPKNASTVIGAGLPSYDFDVKYDNAARTVTITTGTPFAVLPEGAGVVPIVWPAGLADADSLAHATQGAGAYVLTDHAADDDGTLEKRDAYTWGPDGATTGDPGLPDKVEFRIVQNAT